MKKILNHIFIDGLSGMALGLFSTLIIGTIIGQIGTLVGNEIGTYLIAISSVAKTVTGAGIGVGVAAKFKQGPLVTVSAAVAGMIGAFPALGMESFALGKAGEPLGAFVAALIGIECGRLVAGRTKIDIILTPLVSICTGAAAGFIVGPPISNFMKWLGNLVNINVEASPILGGIAVSVLMGMILTLPISSAALGVSMGLTGLAAGAATIGCCCQMVGFAVASYRENKFGGGNRNIHASGAKYFAQTVDLASTDHFQCDFRTDCICSFTYGKYTNRIWNGFRRFCRTDRSLWSNA